MQIKTGAKTNDLVNPYFKGSNPKNVPTNMWTLHTGMLLPAGSKLLQASGSTGTDWVLPAKAAYVVLRFGSCGGAGAGKGKTWFVTMQKSGDDLRVRIFLDFVRRSGTTRAPHGACVRAEGQMNLN